MKKITTALMLLYCTLAHAAETFLVVPNALDVTSGNSALWPFAFETLGITSRRYQQVYEADQFGTLNNQGGFINRLYFRQHGPDVSRTILNVEITLSITSTDAEGLSPI